MKLPELKLLAKEHKIKTSCLNKAELEKLLIEKDLLPKNVEKKEECEINPKYAHLKGIRNNPKSVEIRDRETGETTVYPSIYKATRSLHVHSAGVIINNAGKVWKNRYEISIN